MKYFGLIHLCLISCWVWVSCTGGSITEPWMADVSGQVETQQVAQAKIYLYDAQSPYQALDSTELDVDGTFEFAGEVEAPAEMRILVDVQGTQGALTEVFTAEQYQDNQVNINLQPQDYLVDTLELKSSEAVIQQVKLGYSVLEPVPGQSNLYIIQYLPGQDRIQIIHNQGKSDYQYRNGTLEPVQDEDDLELELSAYQINAQDLYYYFEMEDYSNGQITPRVGDSVAHFFGKSYTPDLGRTGLASQALTLDSSYFSFALPDQFRDGEQLVLEMWIKPDCGEHCGISHLSPTLDTNRQTSRYPDLYMNFDWLRADNSIPPEQISVPDKLTQGEWIHVVYQIGKGTKQAFYVNGVLEVEGQASTMIDSDIMEYFIFGFSFANYFQPVEPNYKGSIQSLRIWNRPLSAAEIAQLANF